MSARICIASDNDPFGVLEFIYWDHKWNNFHYPTDKARNRGMDLIKKSGAGIVRMDFLWQDIEPSRGKIDFSKYDRIVDGLTSRGIKILGVLSYNTDWASPCGKWNVPNSDFKDFLRYCEIVAARYKDRVKYWEIWNEPDSRIYWEPQDGMQEYVRLLRNAYHTLKKTDPDCFVLNGGLASGLVSVNKLYDNGAKDYFDIMNIHAFESPLEKNAIKRITAYVNATAKVMDRNGDSAKKIWITEIGCPGVGKGVKVDDSWMGTNPDEAKQAEWVEEVFTKVLKIGRVEKVFWAFFRDTDRHWNNGVDYFGMVRKDFSLKPSFKAYVKARKAYLKLKGPGPPISSRRQKRPDLSP